MQRDGEFETTKYTKYTKSEQTVSDSFFGYFVLLCLEVFAGYANV